MDDKMDIIIANQRRIIELLERQAPQAAPESPLVAESRRLEALGRHQERLALWQDRIVTKHRRPRRTT